MTTIREQAEEILKRPDVLQRVEILIRNQLHLEETGLRDEIKALGFSVSMVGERWSIEFPGDRYRVRVVCGKEDESAASAIHAMVKLLRDKADELEGLIK